MRKSGLQYARDVRRLRAAGVDLPPARGYLLRTPARWNAGLKSAVTKAIQKLDASAAIIDMGADADGGTPDDGMFDAPDFTPDSEFQVSEEFFDDAAGDEFEEWDDIDYFDFDEADDLVDAEGDDYEEAS